MLRCGKPLKSLLGDLARRLQYHLFPGGGQRDTLKTEYSGFSRAKPGVETPIEVRWTYGRMRQTFRKRLTFTKKRLWGKNTPINFRRGSIPPAENHGVGLANPNDKGIIYG